MTAEYQRPPSGPIIRPLSLYKCRRHRQDESNELKHKIACNITFVEYHRSSFRLHLQTPSSTIRVLFKKNEMSPNLLGLLVLTGVLWGCTNPFIRQGTKGLRDVTATSLLGQAWAEISFLLGNWKYVLPWLMNQAGSLVYIAAVRRAPLSVAVPTANSLAFAFTAITGATVGAEEPLDRWSILGIMLIMGGTALCCYDKTT